MTSHPGYNRSYYKSRDIHTAHAAATILGLIRPVYEQTAVMDLGCGVGTWAATAEADGATSVVAVDGPWVEEAMLQVSAEAFRSCDLESHLPDVSGPIGLTIWAENVEHLTPQRGQMVHDWVCSVSDAVLFSAAVPEQGGTGHWNERWQSAWAADFAHHGFEAADIIRPAIWDDDRIPYWYRQNMILYYRPERVASRLPALMGSGHSAMLDLVHPAKWESTMFDGPGVRRSLMLLRRSLKNAIVKRL